MNKLVTMLMMCGVAAAAPVDGKKPMPMPPPGHGPKIERPAHLHHHGKKDHKHHGKKHERQCPACGCVHQPARPKYRRVPHHVERIVH